MDKSQPKCRTRESIRIKVETEFAFIITAVNLAV